MQRYARVLAPARVIRSDLPPDPDAQADMTWLKINADVYRGQWVALQSGELLASARTHPELMEQIDHPEEKTILITPVY